MTHVAGIDAGTQSVKVVVYAATTREVVASASAPLSLMSGEDGSREQHPSDWVHAMKACFDRIDPRLRAQVSALSV
ncbi:MAG: FGGY family carbohydrate kinase, partial [Luteimonas sp.]|nr:FGGY family carbohydrate kinase [Luteimonas sp.]